MEQRRLGRGLQSLLSSDATIPTGSNVGIDLLTPNRMQPREHFEEAAIDRLAVSIQKSGILQPIVVRPSGRQYEIVAGERRWRAAKKAGLKEVPVVVRPSLSDEEMVELALLENLQRVDLNPIEKAKGFRRLIQEFKKSQEEVGKSVGQDRVTIANTLRLLELPPEIQDAVRQGALSGGHARALLSVPEPARRRALFERVLREELSVRQLEGLAAQQGARRKPAKGKARQPTWTADLEDRWRRRLGVKVELAVSGQRTRITIHCGSLDELERVTDLAVGLPTSSSEPRAETVAEL